VIASPNAAESLARDHGAPVLDGGAASRAAHAAAVRHATASVPGIVTAIESLVDIHSFATCPHRPSLLERDRKVRIKTARP